MTDFDREKHRARVAAARAAITPEEDAAITAAALSDPDNPPLTDEDFARMKPSRPGRPKLARPKVSVTLRVDADVVERFRAKGPGWQSRMNAALKKAVG